MVIRGNPTAMFRAQHGLLTTELIVALSILVLTLMPIAFTFVAESRRCRSYYQEALAMELVDGEMEVLAAGEWRAFPDGKHNYPVSAQSVTNLPPGRFTLTRTEKRLRLEWRPQPPGTGRVIVREVQLP